MKTLFLKVVSLSPFLYKLLIFRKLFFRFLYNKNKISDYKEIKFIKSKVDTFFLMLEQQWNNSYI